jgi:hypothetical protein
MEADIIYKALAKVTLNNPFEYIFVHCSCSKINTKWEQWDTIHYPSTLPLSLDTTTIPRYYPLSLDTTTIPRHYHYPSTLPLSLDTATIPRHCHYPSTLPLSLDTATSGGCVPGQYPLADTDFLDQNLVYYASGQLLIEFCQPTPGHK